MSTSYVYAYHDPRTGLPFYIGVGSSTGRMSYHLREARKRDTSDTNKLKINRIRSLLAMGKPPIVEKIVTNVDLSTAHEIERYLIRHYGRIDQKTGVLTNLTDGGDGPLNRVAHNKGKKFKWMSKDNQSKQVPVDEINRYTSDGWISGRAAMKGRTAYNKGQRGVPRNFDQSGASNPSAKFYWEIQVRGVWYCGYCLKDLCHDIGISTTPIINFMKHPDKESRVGVQHVHKSKRVNR